METESAENTAASQTKSTGRKDAFRLASEVTIIAWGVIVCNLSQIFGSMISFADHLQKVLVWSTLLLPELALLLILPVSQGRYRKATIAALIVVPLCGLALAQPDKAMQVSGPLQNMLTIFAADHMVAVHRKTLDKNSARILYAANSEKAGLGTMVREETMLSPGIRLVKIIHKPSETLFN
ncbi:MAG: hypothetical protein KGS72_06900 [Cyanobacteria bacterium REEB67]|nr:hypothetical protein [Cyanobacteria bacterium REEB67]